MNRLCPLLFSVLAFCLPHARAENPLPFYVWTGIGNGWLGQQPPPTDGSAFLYFFETVVPNVPLTGAYDGLYFLGDSDFTFDGDSAPGATLSLGSGLISHSFDFFGGGEIRFGPNLTLEVPNPETLFMVDNGRIIFGGPIHGQGGLLLSGNAPTFTFSNTTESGNNYSGGTVIAPTSGTAHLALWNSGALGSGEVTIVGRTQFSTRNSIALNNDITIQADNVSFRHWDAPFTLLGDVTLQNDVTFFAGVSQPGYHNADGTGSLPLPGTRVRQPTIFGGDIIGTETTDVGFSGPGYFLITGASAYTGATKIGNGSVVYGSLASLPQGEITVGSPEQGDFSNQGGYIGIVRSSLTSSEDFAQFLARLDPSSSGAVGLDRLPGETSTTPFAGTIDLSGFTSTASGLDGVRLGTATEAIITGNIIPAQNNYAFGNGGGRLYVQSNLNDGTVLQTDEQQGQGGAEWSFRGVNVFSQNGSALAVYLQGNNSYSGPTQVGNGYLIFDGTADSPLTSSLPEGGEMSWIAAAGRYDNIGGSYIGYTERVASPTNGNSALTPSEFLARFDHNGTWGIVGFDTSNPASPVTIEDVDLSAFQNGVFVGTSSAARLTGTITPTGRAYYDTYDPQTQEFTSTANPNAGDTLRLAAVLGGTLTVDAQLTDLEIQSFVPSTTSLAVVVGTTQFNTPSDGTVVLNGDNSYTGGTTLNTHGGITLALGHSNALGTGALDIIGSGNVAGLAASEAGVEIDNEINLIAGQFGGGATVNLTGANNFALNGPISGQGMIMLANEDHLTVSLGGDNSQFMGAFQIAHGELHVTNAHGTGAAPVFFSSPYATLSFADGLSNPTVHGIEGENGTIVLPNATNLVINLAADEDFDFGGSIVSPGGGVALPNTASLTVTSLSNPEGDASLLYLFGSSNYGGGTTITGYAALALGNDQAVGTGPVTINTPEGGLLLNTGVRFTNPIDLQEGGLGGLGTFAPTAINGDSSANRTLTIGAGHVLFPGVPGDRDSMIGQLTLEVPTVAFADGGELEWTMQDADLESFIGTAGYSTVNVIGSVDLSLLGTSGFTIVLNSIDMFGEEGWANMTWGSAYSFRVITTTGGITGFDADDFTLDLEYFQFGTFDESSFGLALSADGKNLMLNFTAVPEPSTYALMALGLGFVGLTIWRRRRRA